MPALNEQLFCDVAECERPIFRLGKCQTHAKQLQRTGETKEIAQRVSLEERVIAAGSAMLESDGDDDEYERLRRSFLVACKLFGRRLMQEASRRGILEALRRGDPFGRPPRVDDARLWATYERMNFNLTHTARRLGMALSSVSERVANLRQKKTFRSRLPLHLQRRK